MPIHCPVTVGSQSDEGFDKIDYQVMAHAYASQNELGRLCDEYAYHADLRARLQSAGFGSVLSEIPVTVTYGNFSKTYRIDLIADNVPYEIKAERTLANDHEAQLFNYLFLVGVRRGKLINFRSPKVEGKIVVTSLTPEKRRAFTASVDRWSNVTPECVILRQAMLDLLKDWGAFLTAGLYEEALIHLLGGMEHIEKRVRLRRLAIDLGAQRMFLHGSNVAFRITGFTQGQRQLEFNMRRLLALTDLKAIQWINLNHSKIEFTTITKSQGAFKEFASS